MISRRCGLAYQIQNNPLDDQKVVFHSDIDSWARATRLFVAECNVSLSVSAVKTYAKRMHPVRNAVGRGGGYWLIQDRDIHFSRLFYLPLVRAARIEHRVSTSYQALAIVAIAASCIWEPKAHRTNRSSLEYPTNR